jgi:hypothetical protein
MKMNLMPLKVIGKEACLQIKILLGYQRILDPKGVKTFYEGKSKNK